MHAEVATGEIRITLVRSLATRQVEVLQLLMPAGATVIDVLTQSGWWSNDSFGPAPCVGVWGKLQPPGHILRDLDRVEIYRGLRVDPKQARRERYADHKAKRLAAELKVKSPPFGD